jgi:hypothetical protein
VHPRATAVVGLKGPLALGHGCSLLVACGIRKPAPINLIPVGTRLPLVSSSVLLASRRGHPVFLGRSRIATCGRLFEGTDENSLGQTSPDRRAKHHNRHSSNVSPAGKKVLPRMLQNGWHSERKLLASANAASITKRRQTTKRGCPTKSRAHRPQHPL